MRRALPCLFLFLLACVPLRGGELQGKVQLKGVPGKRAGAGPAFVYAQPLDRKAAVTPGSYSIEQRHKAFKPSVLVIPVGSRVMFPNQDTIFHNVFSLSPPAPFDLGLYRAGSSKGRVFVEPGTYRVFCNIHPEMTATIVVVPTSFIAPVDPSGNYRLTLPEGRYSLTAWSEKAPPASVQVSVSAGTAAAPGLVLDESSFSERPHKNKFGQDYPPAYDPLKGRSKTP